MRAYLSLGSNLGDRIAQIRRALERLSTAGCKILRVSSFYRTEPVDFHDQPWFINCVADVETDLSPRALLRTALAFERALGRRRTIAKGPRRIDIDILLYENLVVEWPGLVIPHPRMNARRFVLVPLREISPELRHPVTGKTVSEVLRETKDTSRVVRLKEK